MTSEFITCECGSRQPKRKMRSRNGALMCAECAAITEARQKRQERNADHYQVVVSFLDGTQLYFCRTEA